MLKGSLLHNPRSVLAEFQIWLNFKPIRDFMVVLVTCKNEEDPIKNEGARVVTALFIDFSEAQGQLTS